VTLRPTDVVRQSAKTGYSHGGVVQTNCQQNVLQNCEVSNGHASMPAERLHDVGFEPLRLRPRCFEVPSVSSVMGNRLDNCTVGSVVSATTEPPQSVPALVTGSYRDCSWRPPPQRSCAMLHHGKAAVWSSGQQLVPASEVNRQVWVGPHSPANVNGIDNTRCNYNVMVPSQACAQPGCSQIPRPFLPASIPAARLHAGSIPANIRQIWMQGRPQQQQQQVVSQNSASMSPVRSMSVVGVGTTNISPVIWRPRFVSPSLTSARLPVPVAVAAAAECTSVASVTDSCPITGPRGSPAAITVTDSPVPRNNTLGRIYQLPVATAAVTTGQCETCVASSSVILSSESQVTSAQSATSTKTAVKLPVKPAVITPSQPDIERTYVAGRRYTMTKEDGVTVEGIWDGKYLTVTTTSVAKSTASQTSG